MERSIRQMLISRSHQVRMSLLLGALCNGGICGNIGRDRTFSLPNSRSGIMTGVASRPDMSLVSGASIFVKNVTYLQMQRHSCRLTQKLPSFSHHAHGISGARSPPIDLSGLARMLPSAGTSWSYDPYLR